MPPPAPPRRRSGTRPAAAPPSRHRQAQARSSASHCGGRRHCCRPRCPRGRQRSERGGRALWMEQHTCTEAPRLAREEVGQGPPAHHIHPPAIRPYPCMHAQRQSESIENPNRWRKKVRACVRTTSDDDDVCLLDGEHVVEGVHVHVRERGTHPPRRCPPSPRPRPPAADGAALMEVPWHREDGPRRRRQRRREERCHVQGARPTVGHRERARKENQGEIRWTITGPHVRRMLVCHISIRSELKYIWNHMRRSGI